MKFRIKQLITIILVSGMLLTVVNSFAETIHNTVEVAMNAVNIKLNGSDFSSDNILYNDTTYVPLRKIANELGATVDWDEDTNTVKVNTKAQYFPTGIFDTKDESADQFISDWYSGQLSALQEPSLYQSRNDKNTLSFRFLYLRSFGNPISIRIDINAEDNSALLFYKRCNGMGGYEAGPIDEIKKVILDQKDVNKLLDVINKEDFWNLPSTNDDIGSDGSRWIIEATGDGKYHLVDRWSPEEGPVKNIGEFFVHLANVNIELN